MTSTFSVCRSYSSQFSWSARWALVETVNGRTFVVQTFRTEAEARAALAAR